jgi:hypothetical protein
MVKMKTPDFAIDYTKEADQPKVPGGWGQPKEPFIKGGLLVIPYTAGTTRTAGVTLDYAFTYGRVEMTIKADDVNFKTCPLLWPTAGWVAEYDIAEGTSRTSPTQTLHYGDGGHLNPKHAMIHRALNMPAPGLRDWTTLVTIWSKGHIETFKAGTRKLKQSVIDSPDVFAGPMKVHLQVGEPGDNKQSGNMYVKSVRIWKG